MFLLSGRSEEAVVELINLENPSLPIAIDVGDLYFGKIRAGSEDRIIAPAAPMYHTLYEGYVDLSYKRVDLGAVFSGIVPIIQDTGQGSLHLLLPSINKALGTNFQAEDFLDAKIDWVGSGEQVNLRLTARPNSLGYQGSFIVRFIRIRPQLSDVIGTKELVVLRHPVTPGEGNLSLAMETWGIDFSDHWKVLGTQNYYWANITPMRAVMAELGYANWPQGTLENPVKAYATADRPEANKAFSTVVIQKNVTIDGKRGDAYFHYNRL